MSYSNRRADLLFELINRRHERKRTLITTNKSFSERSEVFPNASCVVAMIDRLVHHSEILSIKGGVLSAQRGSGEPQPNTDMD